MKGPYRPNINPGARADRIAAMEKFFGPLDQLQAEFSQWCKERRNTFHYVEWGWEEDFNTLVAYGFAEGGRLSQTDLLLPPGEKPVDDPWRLDYAAAPMPPTVGPVARGVAEPAIGALLDFSEDPHRGVAGIGLGVMSPEQTSADGLHADHDTQLKILVREGRTLEIDGSELSFKPVSEKIPDDVQKAMEADKQRIGLTAIIGKTELRIVLRAKKPDEPRMAEFSTALAIDAAVRKRLLDQRVSILARDGWQRITPFFDPGPRPEPDPPHIAPIGRWRNPAERELQAVWQAWTLLETHCPKSLDRLRTAMTQAANSSSWDQNKALKMFQNDVDHVIGDIRQCGAAQE
jgi:hypothetical protein